MFYAFNKGRAKDTTRHEVITSLLRVQAEGDFTLKLRWVASADNAEEDDLSQPEVSEYVRLDPSKFAELWSWVGPFDMDLMATPASAHTGQAPHLEALHVMLSALGVVVSILSKLKPRVHVEDIQGASRSLVKVSSARARVLCPRCHGENEEQFRHCQWCSRNRPDLQNQAHSGLATLLINEVALAKHLAQFETAAAAQASTKSRSATAVQFSNFLACRRAGGAAHIEQTQPQAAVQCFCWRDTSGLRRRAVVHARDCEAVGTSNLSSCSASSTGESAIRNAHESLRTNHLSKRPGVFEKELGVTGE